ncbi:hypothetical protein [Sphingorhabdus sp.]
MSASVPTVAEGRANRSNAIIDGSKPAAKRLPTFVILLKVSQSKLILGR